MNDFPLKVFGGSSHPALTRAVCDHLGCSSSQLIKMLRHHPPALARLNGERAERGLQTYR